MINNLYKLKDKVSFARSETTLIMEPYQSNSQGFIHGGELMKIMDMAAGIVGRMHSKGLIVTAKVDDMVFHKPVNIGNTITCIGQLVYVGKSSMIVMVNLVIHNINDFSNPIIAVSGMFNMVHIVDGKPTEVLRLKPSNKEENEIYEYGERKYRELKKLDKER